MDADGSLVERQQAMETVVEAVDRLRATGAGAMALVEGTAGIGKTHLLAHAAAACARRGLLVLGARGGELEDTVTFGVVRQLFERHLLGLPAAEQDDLFAGAAGLARAAVGVTPAGLTFSPETGPLHGLHWLVAGLTRRAPLVLVVDDVHWADDESLRFLLYLARRLDDVPVLLLLATRPAQASRALDLLAAELAGPALRLSPLSPEGTAALVRERLGDDVPAPVVEACHAVSGGVPLFVREIAEELAQRPATGVEEAVAQVRTLLPATVVRSVLLRLGVEDEDLRRVAAALAVLDDASSLRLVADVAGLDEERTSTALDRLVAIGLAAPSGTLALAHPVIRAALHTDLGQAQRLHLHARAAEALDAQGAPAAAVAQHLLRAAPAGRPAVAATLAEAAEQAVGRGSPDTAARLLARALAEPPDPATRAGVLVALGRAEAACGERASAAEHLREALGLELTAAQRGATALELARALVEIEGPLAAVSVLEQQTGRLAGDDALRVEVEHTMLTLHAAIGDRMEAAEARLGRWTALPGDTANERFALATAQWVVSIRSEGRSAITIPLLSRASGGGRLLTEQGVESQAVSTLLYGFAYAEEYATLTELATQGMAEAQARGSAFGHFAMTVGAQVAALGRGDVQAAIALGERGLALHPELSSPARALLPASFLCRFTVEALLARGEHERAGALVAQWLTYGDVETMDYVMVRFARGLLAAADGDHAAALSDSLAVGAFYRAVGFETRTTPWRLVAARAAAALGDHRAAGTLVEEAGEVAAQWGAPGGIGEAAHVAALVGPRDAAPEALAAAVAQLRGTSKRLALAEALVDLGRSRRGAGSRREARATLEEASDLAHRCGAVAVAERARAELVVLGARPRKLAFSGADSLTASEQRIARMAADGLTNREIAQALFVTAKTVESHLSRIYRKLGITSRTALAAALG